MLTKISRLVILLSLTIAALTSVSAQPKQVTEQELDTSLELARSLVNEKKYPEALKAYLFVFDNSRGVGAYGGVRLSYVPSEKQ